MPDPGSTTSGRTNHFAGGASPSEAACQLEQILRETAPGTGSLRRPLHVQVVRARRERGERAITFALVFVQALVVMFLARLAWPGFEPGYLQCLAFIFVVRLVAPVPGDFLRWTVERGTR